MSHLSTHVLDAMRGAPAAHVFISLAAQDPGGQMQPLAEGSTDADGRLTLGPETLEPGIYHLSFGSGAYFADRGVETFYPVVIVTFTVEPGATHHHVPLLLSPFAYSTYRGS